MLETELNIRPRRLDLPPGTQVVEYTHGLDLTGTNPARGFFVPCNHGGLVDRRIRQWFRRSALNTCFQVSRAFLNNDEGLFIHIPRL